MNHGCKLRVAGVLLLACALEGCPTRPSPPPVAVGAPASPPPIARRGRPYDIVAEQSQLTLLVYRGGTLASAGHNHVIASHTLRGTFYVPAEPLETTFEARLPVASLTIDEPQLREQESPADFPPEVPQGAREGTRRNMLGPAVLDADDYPEVRLQSLTLERASPAGPGEVTAAIAAEVRGQWHTVRMPLHYALAAGRLTVTGESPLKQSELGLTPFSAFLGALAVQDEMHLKLRLVARAAQAAR